MKFGTENIGFTPKKSEEPESLNLKEKTRFNSDKETRDFNYSKKEDIDVHDPHHNYFNGIKNFENEVGSDIDLDNYYHPGFEGFEDEEATPENPIDDSEKNGEIGAFMEKYGLEEFELEDLMRDCNAYQNGKKIPAPLENDTDLKELALLYKSYLLAKNENEPSFNKKGLERLSENDLEKLADLYREKSESSFRLAEINSSLNNNKNKLENVPVLVSNSTEKKNSPAITLRPEVIQKREQTKERDELVKKISEINEQISVIKEPVNQRIAQVKAIDAQREINIQEAKDQAIKNNNINLWKNVPEYSEKEIALRESVLAYVRKENGARKPFFEDGQELNKEQIEDVLREVARDQGWDKANFFAEVRKTKDKNGREQNIRQLAAVQNLDNGRRVKHTFASNNLQAGQYFYKDDPKSFFISKNNPDSAIAPINFFISTERPKKTLPEDVVKKMTEVAAEKKPAESKVEIIKKKAPEVVEKRTPIIIKKEVSKDKPAPVIKKKINEPAI